MMMKMRTNKFWMLTITCLFLLLLSACSPKDKLLGVWEEQGGDIHVRFLTGDTLSQKVYFGEDLLTLTGTYDIINDSQIRLEFQEGDWQGLKSGLYNYSIDGNTLTLDDLTLERQPDVYNLEG